TLQLTVSITLNGQVVNDKTVMNSTNDSNIATVDANGLITAINTGSVTVTAQLADNPTVQDAISLTVEDLPRDNYALTINGDTFVTKGYSKTWTASLTNNG
ncbi:Ig-like domain-containing protein, partial [Pseudomonas aeruginosa]|uniref:Ig-like domain-containing protein n=1 Tax=Pseudomonas aeruginosa TaxID=287 RepID=UPI003969C61D